MSQTEQQPMDEVLPVEPEPVTEENPVPEETVEPELSEPSAPAVLTDDFLLLQQEVPELQSMADLPEAVRQEAQEQRLSLLDAYLRYRWREERAVREERERQQRNGEQTAGSLYTGDTQQHPVADAFARAFEQALR